MRLLAARVAMTDGFYAHGAWMWSHGLAPYVDFTQVAFPLAESVLALAFKLAGPGHRVVELVDLLVVLGVAGALFAAGRRLAGPWAGAVAALAWSGSTWVLHFHLFERETWTALGTALALVAYLGSEDGRLSGRRALAVAAGLLLAFLIKITAVMAAAGLCLHLLVRGRWRAALRVGLLYAAGIVLATLACWSIWGTPFLWQVYVFGFFRNQTHDLLGALGEVAAHADPTMILGAAGLVLYGLPRLRRPAGVLVFVLASDLLYATVVSPTIWDHNMINFVPPLALLLGGWLDTSVSGRRRSTALIVGAALALMVALGWLGREGVVRWVPGERGLGLTDGRERSWLAEQASFVKAHSGPDDVIACIEPWVALEAGRVKLVRSWDLEPVALGVEASLRADGLVATLGKAGTDLLIGPGHPAHDPRLDAWVAPYERRLWANALVYVRPRILQALARHEVALVLEPLLPGLLEAGDLLDAGYERIEGPGAAGWRPADGVAHPVVHPLYAR